MRPWWLGWLAAWSLWGGLVGACAPVLPEGGGAGRGRVDAVVGGTEAPGDGAGVALVARRVRCAGESLTVLCSGTLIAPDVVLTAAHCLEVFGPGGAYEVFLGEQLLPEEQTRGHFVRVARAVRHPAYDRETHAHDVALLRLAEAVEELPYRLPGAEEGLLAPGQSARVVGFGDTHAPDEFPGLRRQGTLRVTEVTLDGFRAGPAPAMSCVGDSGGPVLVRDAQGQEVLAGITVSGDFACQKEAVNARVDALRESFLQPFLEEPREAPGPVLALDSLCATGCARDADCPAGLSCDVTAEGTRRCFLAALQPGDYGASCGEDEACGVGGLCARVGSGPDAGCHCFMPCAAPSSEEDSPRRGCAVAPGPGVLGMVAFFAFFMGLQRRARAVHPRR